MDSIISASEKATRSRSTNPKISLRQTGLNPLDSEVEQVNITTPLMGDNIKTNNNRPMLASPETLDDSENDKNKAVNTKPYPEGVDDGFLNTQLDNENKSTKKEPMDTNINEEKVPNNDIDENDGALRPSRRPSVGFPHEYSGHHNHHHDLEIGSGILMDEIPDLNVYQHKKTLAQGMMDLALFSANANQLRYVLDSYSRHPYYYPSMILILFSLCLQIGIGVLLIWNSIYNVKDEKEVCRANKINNYTVIGIFLVTVVNVFISAFGVADPPSVTAQVLPPQLTTNNNS